MPSYLVNGVLTTRRVMFTLAVMTNKNQQTNLDEWL